MGGKKKDVCFFKKRPIVFLANSGPAGNIGEPIRQAPETWKVSCFGIDISPPIYLKILILILSNLIGAVSFCNTAKKKERKKKE